MAEKPHLNLVFIGHVDHGKSTLVGRLLYEVGEVSEQTMKKYKEEAEKMGKGTFEFAWVMDSLKEERERGVTIDIAHRKFQTQKNFFTIIDAPGHRDFVKNMITGASQADAAILVVSSKDGVQPQTKEHAFLARTLGVNQLIVALNKVDAINYDEAQYNKVKDEVSKLLSGIGYKVANIEFIPVSAYVGDNVKTKSEKPMVQRQNTPTGDRRPQSPGETHRQATKGASTGRLHHHRSRNRPGRKGRNRSPQAGNESNLHAGKRRRRSQNHRDAP